MPVYVKEVILDALELLIVQQEERALPSAESSSAIRALNDLMFELDIDGIALGYTEVSATSDLMTVPRGAIRAIKALLAVDLAPKYGVEVSTTLSNNAEKGRRSLENLTTEVGQSPYPSTLPKGRSNTPYSGLSFYNEESSDILDETGGSIELEEDTE